MRTVRLILILVLVGGPFVFMVMGNLMVSRYEAEVRPEDLPGIHSYFKTPQAAVISIEEMVEKKDWGRLSQFYDLTRSELDRATLESGAFFESIPSGQTHAPPFAPGYHFSEILGTEFSDVYEVVVTRQTLEAGSGSAIARSDLQFFYLKRYPEGYQILPARPTAEGEDRFQ